ncbi:P-loop containing nucleoside triphosphate hydrolase protein [Hypoxylon sp. FL1284]|nr:P-loop containing nucleoside triphosphate hydrolase protein [Hypoxylon sp. FL1284]
MDDTSSVASFEKIGPSRRGPNQGFGHPEDVKHVEKLKALVARSAANGGAAKELAEDDVTDVCYVLQYRGWDGRLTDVSRSREPINIRSHDTVDEGFTSTKKHILEIVTKVSTQLVKKNRRPRRPRYTREWSPDYDSPYDRETSDDEDSEMKITQVEKTSMVIRSIHLVNALKAVVGYYPGASFVDDVVSINAPYVVLYHHREELAHYKDSQPAAHDAEYAMTTARHIDVVLDFLDKTLGDQIRKEELRHKNPIPTATFDKLWLIMKPGEVVYAKHDYGWTPFIISRVRHDSPGKDDRPGSYIVDCWNITYSAERFSRTMQTFDVESFTGEEAITNLSVIPARFFRGEKGDMDPEEARKKQIELGRAAWALAKGPRFMSYEGTLVSKDETHDWEESASATGYISGRVVVDCPGLKYSFDYPGEPPRPRRHSMRPPHRPAPPKDSLPYLSPSCGCSACDKENSKGALSPFASFEDLDPARDSDPEPELYFIALSKTVPGFILGERRWGYFAVENLSEVKFDKEAFKYLVLDDDVKQTVRALVGKFASAGGQISPWPNDFIKNKGQGRIFLLHGSPGVGKTCTAECVAELTHRPLISLTSGDLSTSAYSAEKSLEYFLQLGERFGAMVLLDEADVYLEARRSQDIERNGLVSVFLRALEYYRGLLFLTTNRVQTFDAAFTSRVHVALHYRALTDRDRERIWLNSFERLERDSGGRVRAGLSTREYAYASQDVRSLRWNGREIRNALQTAVALAETEALDDGAAAAVVVSDRHLRAVVKMSRGFKTFLEKHRGDRDDDVEEESDEA